MLRRCTTPAEPPDSCKQTQRRCGQTQKDWKVTRIHCSKNHGNKTTATANDASGCKAMRNCSLSHTPHQTRNRQGMHSDQRENPRQRCPTEDGGHKDRGSVDHNQRRRCSPTCSKRGRRGTSTCSIRCDGDRTYSCMVGCVSHRSTMHPRRVHLRLWSDAAAAAAAAAAGRPGQRHLHHLLRVWHHHAAADRHR